MKNLNGLKTLKESKIFCDDLTIKNKVWKTKRVPTITNTYTLSVDEFINGFIVVDTNVSMQVNLPTPVSSWGLKANDTFFFTMLCTCGASGANSLSYSASGWLAGGSFAGFTANTTRIARYLFQMTSATTFRGTRWGWYLIT